MYFQIQQSMMAPASGAETQLNAAHNYEPFYIEWYQNRFWTQTA